MFSCFKHPRTACIDFGYEQELNNYRFSITLVVDKLKKMNMDAFSG
jgi:hypothetical protein